MKFAVIGSGGREHAICYKLKQSKKIGKLICLPGNAGTEKIAKNIEVDISNFNLVYETIKDEKNLKISDQFSKIIQEFPDSKWKIKKLNSVNINQEIYQLNVFG